MKLFTMLAAIALSAPAMAQVPVPAPAPQPAPIYQTIKVVLSTRDGPIVLELEKERAPITSANFLRYVDQKRLDGATVYRAATAPNSKDYGLIQFGTKNEPKRTLSAIAHEPTSKTGLSHKDGTISLARAAPGTGAGS